MPTYSPKILLIRQCIALGVELLCALAVYLKHPQMLPLLREFGPSIAAVVAAAVTGVDYHAFWTSPVQDAPANQDKS